jgi:hypothetical protein
LQQLRIGKDFRAEEVKEKAILPVFFGKDFLSRRTMERELLQQQ